MRTAVYALIFDGKQVYVGVAGNPERRLKQHRAARPEGSAITMEILGWHTTRAGALTAECDLIRDLLPPWNGTYAAKTARKSARRAKDYAAWEALAAKNKANWDAAAAEYDAEVQG